MKSESRDLLSPGSNWREPHLTALLKLEIDIFYIWH